MLQRALWTILVPACVFTWRPHTSLAAGHTAVVGRWDRFEISIPNMKRHSDPFKDVTLNVTYNKPDGGTVDFWGFYDGNGTWCARFMPDQIGAWRYDATFSDSSKRVRGAFKCVSSDIPGMISRDQSNPMWFGFTSGRHVLIRSFHVGDRLFADEDNTRTGEKWNPAMRSEFLDWAQSRGYNMLSIASHYLNRDSEGRGKGWNTPDLWDAAHHRPNPAEYRRLEDVLSDLAARRIMVYPFAGFFGRASDSPREETEQELYIRYSLARLGPYFNVLFSVGGPEPLLRGRPFLTADQINWLGSQIRALDVFGHLVSVHNPTGDDQFKDSAWSSYGILQGPKTTDRARLSAILLKNHPRAKPLYAQETFWPGNTHGHPRYTDADIRKNAFVIMMSAAAINFADMDGNSSSGFSGTMDLTRRVQSRHAIIHKVWDFFETVPFYRMKPRQDLVDNGYCLAEPGREYLVYLEKPGTVSLDFGKGPFTVRWINAQDTADIRDGGVTETPQDATQRHGKNLESPQDGDDWMLHLRSVSGH